VIFGSPKPKAVAQSIRSAVTAKLGIDARQLDQFQTLEQNGNYAGRRVRRVRVFDPRLLQGDASKVTYSSLDRNKAVIFEGHFERNGALVISDRRQAEGAPTAAPQPA